MPRPAARSAAHSSLPDGSLSPSYVEQVHFAQQFALRVEGQLLQLLEAHALVQQQAQVAAHGGEARHLGMGRRRTTQALPQGGIVSSTTNTGCSTSKADSHGRQDLADLGQHPVAGTSSTAPCSKGCSMACSVTSMPGTHPAQQQLHLLQGVGPLGGLAGTPPFAPA